ncbi:MAG: TIGR02147 family protein, partial [Pseudomonadota bacterium]
MVEITEYKDYRAFLKARYEEVKGKTLTFEKVAQKLGASKSFFKMLIDQKRNTTMDRLCEISKILNLSDFEKQYVIFLFLYNTSQEESAKAYFQSVLLSMHYSRPQEMPALDPKPEVPRDFFYSWLALQIICLTGFPDFFPDSSVIHQRLGGDKVAKLHHVNEVLSWMIENKLLIQKEGKWVSSEKEYHAPTDDFDS